MADFNGTSGDDDFDGTPGNDTLNGNDGNDSLEGFGGADLINGGNGLDVLASGNYVNGNSGFPDRPPVSGFSSRDLTLDRDTLMGGGGDDILFGGYGDNLDGGEGLDRLAIDLRSAPTGVDFNLGAVLSGQAISLGGGTINGFNGVTNVVGSAFADTIRGLASLDALNPSTLLLELRTEIAGGGGDDVIFGGLGVATVDGGVGNDTLSGGELIIGGDGNDVIASTGRFVEGGSGNDVIDIATFAAGFSRYSGGLGDDTMTTHGVSGIVYGDEGNDWLRAVTPDNGVKVIDFLSGGWGNDTMQGDGGGDLFIGGTDNDLYYINYSDDRIREAAGEGIDTAIVNASAGSYQLGDGAVETLSAAAGAFAINIAGNQFAQVINGNDGNNVLSTGGGASDTMLGGLGDDTYRVFATGDVIDDSGGFDTVYTSGTSYFLYSTASIEYLSAASQAGTDAIYLVGNGSAQVIAGTYGDNIINGRGGNGQANADTLIGLYGNDTYAVFVQGDVVREAAGQGNDVVFAQADYQLREGTEIEGLAAADAGSATDTFTLRGNELGQAVVGNQAANVLDGRGGNDVLVGLGGSDTFAFTTAVAMGNVDVIQDFAAGDRIGLASDIFAAVVGGGVVANEFVLGTAAADADDRLIYEQASGKLWYDADGSGGGAAVQFAQLAAGTMLTMSDFVTVAPVASLPSA